MKFIRPTPITDAVLVTSSVPETDHAAWNAATAYTAGDRVISTTTHHIYESVQAGNVGHALTDEAWWLDVGAVNRWRMFDQGVGSQTSQAGSIVVTLAPGLINSLALLDIAASTVQIEVVADAVTIYDQTFQIGDSTQLSDWFEYFFEDIASETQLTVVDLPVYSGGAITVTITAPVTAKVGTLAVGKMIDMGSTLTNPRVGIIDYSRKETDAYGNTTVIERSYAKRVEASVMCANGRLDYITNNLAAVRATPVVWIADDLSIYTSLTVYGFVKDWGIVIPYNDYSEAQLTIEGLV